MSDICPECGCAVESCDCGCEEGKDFSPELDSIKAVIEKKGLDLSASEDGLHKLVTMALKKSEADYLPSDEDLKKINQIALAPLTKEQVRVFQVHAADREVDRSYEQFSTKALQQMAELAVKNRIPWLMEGEKDHEWRQKNVFGVVFDAQVKGSKLIYNAYIPVIDKTKSVLDAVMTGLYNKVSVGFSMAWADYKCSSCKKSMVSDACDHMPGMLDEKGNMVYGCIEGVKDNFEFSGVAIPAQREAHVMSKELDAPNTTTVTNSTPTLRTFDLTVNEFRDKPDPDLITVMVLTAPRTKELVIKVPKDSEKVFVDPVTSPYFEIPGAIEVREGKTYAVIKELKCSTSDPTKFIARILVKRKSLDKSDVGTIDIDTKEEFSVENQEDTKAVEAVTEEVTESKAEEQEAPAPSPTLDEIVAAVKELMPEIPAPVEVKTDLSEVTEAVKAAVAEIKAEVEALKSELSQLHAKLDAAIEAPVDAVTKKLAELKEQVKAVPSPTALTKTWTLDRFGKDLGGQEQ